MPVQLHDGCNPINTIALILYMRDAAEYLTEFLVPYLHEMENKYACEFSYYILENDSVDSTADVLRTFMETRKGKFISKTLQLNNVNGDISKTRIERITLIRNMLLDEIRQDIIKTDWCLFIDDSIYPDENLLQHIIDKQPALHNIGMITCNTLELLKNDGSKNVPDTVKFMTENHYYDTFAYVDLDNNSYYPNCAHQHCTRADCKKVRSGIKCFNQEDKNIRNVRCAWGGFVFIWSKVFEHEEVKWKTLSINNRSICEHIYLCDMIKAFTQKRIVLLEDSVCFWIKWCAFVLHHIFIRWQHFYHIPT